MSGLFSFLLQQAFDLFRAEFQPHHEVAQHLPRWQFLTAQEGKDFFKIPVKPRSKVIDIDSPRGARIATSATK